MRAANKTSALLLRIYVLLRSLSDRRDRLHLTKFRHKPFGSGATVIAGKALRILSKLMRFHVDARSTMDDRFHEQLAATLAEVGERASTDQMRMMTRHYDGLISATMIYAHGTLK